MTPSKLPTMKMRKFAKLYVATGSKATAFERAYDLGSQGGKRTRGNAQTMGGGILKSPLVQELVRQELDKVGLTEGKVARKLNEIIDEGTTGKKLEFSTPNLALDAIKEVNKMKGNYAAEKKQVDKRTLNLKADLSGKSMGDLMHELNLLKNRMQSFKKVVSQMKQSPENIEEAKKHGVL